MYFEKVYSNFNQKNNQLFQSQKKKKKHADQTQCLQSEEKCVRACDKSQTNFNFCSNKGAVLYINISHERVNRPSLIREIWNALYVARCSSGGIVPVISASRRSRRARLVVTRCRPRARATIQINIFYISHEFSLIGRLHTTTRHRHAAFLRLFAEGGGRGPYLDRISRMRVVSPSSPPPPLPSFSLFFE